VMLYCHVMSVGEEIRQEELGTAASERQDFLDSHV